MLPVPFIRSALFEGPHCESTPSARSSGCTSKQTKASVASCPHKVQSNAGYGQLSSDCNAMRKVLWFVKPLGLMGAHRMRIHLNQTESGRRSWRAPLGAGWKMVPGMCQVLGGQGALFSRYGSLGVSSGSCMQSLGRVFYRECHDQIYIVEMCLLVLFTRPFHSMTVHSDVGSLHLDLPPCGLTVPRRMTDCQRVIFIKCNIANHIICTRGVLKHVYRRMQELVYP